VDLVNQPETPAKVSAASRAPRRIAVKQKPFNPALSVLFILVFPALVFAGLVALSTRSSGRSRLRS
jgi:hypothetical protein